MLKNMWGEFDLENSMEIKCSSDVFKLESVLHYIFAKYNVHMEEKFEGYTEWFSIDCFNAVLSIVNSIMLERVDIIEISKGIKTIIIKNKIESCKLSAKENLDASNKLIQFLEKYNTSISCINTKVGILKLVGLDKKVAVKLFSLGVFYNFNFFLSCSFAENTICVEFQNIDTLNCGETKLALADVYKYFFKLEQLSHLNSEIECGEKMIEKSSKNLLTLFESKTTVEIKIV